MRGESMRRLRCVQAHVAAQTRMERAAATSEREAAAQPRGVLSGGHFLTDEQVATFVADGFVVLPNLVEAGDIDQAVCDEIFAMGYAQRDKPGMGPSRTELFEQISANMNKVMASPTVQGGLESLLGPGYFMPAWNTHLHINGTGDGGFHADGTDHGPTQTTVRDHRPRQIFGFFYPGDVPLENGPTAVIPGSHYPAVDRIDPTTRLHRTASEDGFPQELPPHLHHVISSEDRLQADVPNKQRGPFSDASAPSDKEDELAAADRKRLEVAAAMLGVDKVEEMKLTCKPGTVMLVHHDLFHRASRRLPDVWRPLFVLRDAVRMVEPDGPAWKSKGAQPPPMDPPLPANKARSAEVAALHRTMWRYLIGEGEETVHYQPEPLPVGSTLHDLVAKVTDESAADIDRVAAAYATGRTQTPAAVRALVKLLSHPHESARRAAGYGLTVGGSLAADAMIKLLRSPPAIPARDPPVADNIDEQAAAIPPLAHVLSQLAEHAMTLEAVAALVAAQARAKSEIEEYSGRVHFVREDGLYDFYVIQRRRAMTECNFALGHIGQAAAARNNSVVCSACVSALLAVACDPKGEPGELFGSYMTSLRVVHSAITNLIRLGSSASSRAATPLVHGTPNNLVPGGAARSDPEWKMGMKPQWAVNGSTASSMRSMAGEAATRLREACAPGSPAANDARREALRLLEGAEWVGFNLPAADEPSAFLLRRISLFVLPPL